MKHKLLWIAALIGILPAACKTSTGYQPLRLFDLKRQQILIDNKAIERFQGARIVLVGEHHNNAGHHQAQLKVIQTLHEAGRQVAIGLEMFRKDSQEALDQWVAGRTSVVKFKPIYLDNWNFSWNLYGPIFNYAKENRIPMIGLNVSRKITAQVAYHGFGSLNEVQRGSLEGITCNVTEEYRDFIRRAYGAHDHGNMNFNRFCEAQLVWDTAMAVYAIDYLKQHPGKVLVILAGSGHARKLGIPSQLEKRIPWPYIVVLPETKGVFDANTLSVKDADFILLND